MRGEETLQAGIGPAAPRLGPRCDALAGADRSGKRKEWISSWIETGDCPCEAELIRSAIELDAPGEFDQRGKLRGRVARKKNYVKSKFTVARSNPFAVPGADQGISGRSCDYGWSSRPEQGSVAEKGYQPPVPANPSQAMSRPDYCDPLRHRSLGCEEA